MFLEGSIQFHMSVWIYSCCMICKFDACFLCVFVSAYLTHLFQGQLDGTD
jgi:hypothetical protein